jgi:hypothetical protein
LQGGRGEEEREGERRETDQ